MRWRFLPAVAIPSGPTSLSAQGRPPLSCLVSRSAEAAPSPPPLLLLGVEIAFQLPFAFPINPDSAIKPAGGAAREAAAGTGPLGAVASAPLPFRPRLLPAPPCAAGRPGREREPPELLLLPRNARRARGSGQAGPAGPASPPFPRLFAARGRGMGGAGGCSARPLGELSPAFLPRPGCGLTSASRPSPHPQPR